MVTNKRTQLVALFTLTIWIFHSSIPHGVKANGFYSEGLTGGIVSVGGIQTLKEHKSDPYLSLDLVTLFLFNIGLLAIPDEKDQINAEFLGLGIGGYLMLQVGSSSLGPVLRLQSHVDIVDMLNGEYNGPFRGDKPIDNFGISIGYVAFRDNSEKNLVSLGIDYHFH